MARYSVFTVDGNIIRLEHPVASPEDLAFLLKDPGYIRGTEVGHGPDGQPVEPGPVVILGGAVVAIRPSE